MLCIGFVCLAVADVEVAREVENFYPTCKNIVIWGMFCDVIWLVWLVG